jgi:hypothetical protein
VVVGRSAHDVALCELVLTDLAHASDVVAVGVETYVLSGHPLGAPATAVPSGAEDFARDVPLHGDSWNGPSPASPSVVAEGWPVAPADVACGPQDRVLVGVDLSSADGLSLLLGVLARGAAVVLVPSAASADPAELAAVVADEQVTATAGVDVPGVPRVRAGG